MVLAASWLALCLLAPPGPSSSARVIELGKLGAVQVGSDVRWGWPGLAGRGFSISTEPRMIHRFEAKLVAGPLTGLRAEWTTVRPTPDPKERRGLGRVRPTSGLPNMASRVAFAIPNTNLAVMTQRLVLVPRTRTPPDLAPRGAYLSGRF